MLQAKHFPNIEVPKDLKSKVINRLVTTEKRNIRTERSIGFAFFIAAFSSISYLCLYAAKELIASGFYNYFSLIFTDTKVVFANFSDFSAMILESLPFFTIIALLSMLIILLFAYRYMRKPAPNLISYNAIIS